MRSFFIIYFLLISVLVHAQIKPFRFAFISDTHIGSPNGTAEQDLQRTVADINSLTDVAFVVLTGDITELGTDEELKTAKKLLDALKIPYYIIPGNHDTGWSESGGLSFTKTFGYDKFFFNYNGVNFIGCASGPYVRMSDGHVPRDAMIWMQKELKKLDNNAPLVFLNHYPLDPGLDNWYEVIDLLKTKNTILALCGHGHNNRKVVAEEIPAVMGRSNLRAKANEGGYNLVNVTTDSIHFIERKPLSKGEKKWNVIPLKNQQYDQTKKFPRPDFSINKKYTQVKSKWIYNSDANIISTPVVVKDLVVFGNQNGLIEAVKISNGKRKWKFNTSGPIFSSPAVSGNNIVLGSADGFVYCLNNTGKLQWKVKNEKAVLGSPVIEKNIVYIGGSDGRFNAYNLNNGKIIWSYSALEGPVVSKPVIHDNYIIFGAWDKYLYCLNKENGQLLWKWDNGSSVINFSPASCIPVVNNGVVYIVAPDRYLSAIDIRNGKTLWRTNEATVRESIGISQNGNLIYGKTMQDTIAAFYTNEESPTIAWKMHVGFGYEHAPSMLIEKEGTLFFGTRNGVVYAIDPATQLIVWAHKIDNSMINTVNVLNNKQVIASTMDGKVTLLIEK